jgi:hypothetical protein
MIEYIVPSVCFIIPFTFLCYYNITYGIRTITVSEKYVDIKHISYVRDANGQSYEVSTFIIELFRPAFLDNGDILWEKLKIKKTFDVEVYGINFPLIKCHQKIIGIKNSNHK